MEIRMMMYAYGMLYQIENALRSYIERNMKEYYGVDWYICAPLYMKYPPYKKSFSSLNLHELISMLSAYECLQCAFENSDILHLQTIISIRNKIAHSHKLIRSEYDKLYFVYKILKQPLSIKAIKTKVLMK